MLNHMVPKAISAATRNGQCFRFMLNHMVPKAISAATRNGQCFRFMLNHMVPKGQIGFTWCVK